MAIGTNHYLEVISAMTPEERKQLSDSVSMYDQATKNKIIKSHLDARATKLNSQTNIAEPQYMDIKRISDQRDVESRVMDEKPIIENDDGTFNVGTQKFKDRNSAFKAQMRIANSRYNGENRIEPIASTTTPKYVNKVSSLFKPKKSEFTPKTYSVGGIPGVLPPVQTFYEPMQSYAPASSTPNKPWYNTAAGRVGIMAASPVVGSAMELKRIANKVVKNKVTNNPFNKMTPEQMRKAIADLKESRL